MHRTPMPAYIEVPVGFSTPCVKEDLDAIRDILTERGDPLTLDNAVAVLAVGLRNRPDAWTITPEELPGLWVGMAQA